MGTDTHWMPFKITKSKLLMSVLEVILVLGLAYLMATSFWTIFTPSKTNSPFTQKQTNIRQTYRSPSRDNHVILSAFDPFNRTSIAPITNQPIELAPETSLDLKLLGVRQNLADQNTGSAIIRLPNSKERVFNIGQEIIDQVSLREIFTTHVTISRAGSVETLYLEGVDPDQVQQQTIKASQPIEVTETIERSVSIKALTNFTTTLKLSPNERPKGLKITDQTNANLLNSLGLIEGDIIISVNGNAATTNKAILTAITRTNSARPLKLQIIRGVKPINFLINLTR